MLHPLLILESLRTGVALKLSVVQRLYYKSVHLLPEVEIAAAVRAGLIPLCPFVYAAFTAKLIALLALLGLLHYIEADSAREVFVNASDSAVPRQLLARIVCLTSDLFQQVCEKSRFWRKCFLCFKCVRLHHLLLINTVRRRI